MIKLNNNFPNGLRPEFGRWRQLIWLTVAIEQELLDENRVLIDKDGTVRVHFERHSPYAELAVKRSRSSCRRSSRRSPWSRSSSGRSE